MREDALIAEVRKAAQLPDAFPDYTDAIIRAELNTQLQLRFARVLVKARVGMLLKPYVLTMEVGTGTYPLPGRAMAAGFEALELSDGSSRWPLTELQASQTWAYETMTPDRPRFYVVIGSSIRFYPSPSQAYTARCQYYLRPSSIVEKQSTEAIGRILGLSVTTGNLVLGSNVSDILDRINVGAISQSRYVDIIRGAPDGALGAPTTITEDASYEVVAVNQLWQPGAFATYLQLSGSFDLSEVRAGDFVRAAGQSEWPTMPHEYHPALAWAVAAKICRDRGMRQTAQDLESDVSAAIGDMADDVQPRAKSQAQALVPAAHMLRGRRGWTL